MNPIPFMGQSATLSKPADMTDDQCQSLHILRLDNVCISCWHLTWIDRIKALLMGRVWLGVHSGQTQPPVYLTFNKPFKLVEE